MTKQKINLRMHMITRTIRQIAKNINHYHVCTNFSGGCGAIVHKGAKHCIQCGGRRFRKFKEGEIESCMETAGKRFKLEVRDQTDSYTPNEFRKIVGEEI